MLPHSAPILVGHRGWPACWPENTLQGFVAAAETGARWLECDVQVSSDHLPFICHDVSLKRTAGIDLDITTTSATQLDGISVGEPARFGNRFAAVRLARLAALVNWLPSQAGLRQFVEIKRESLRRHGRQAVVDVVMHALQPALRQCVVISFDHASLELARRQGAASIGWAVENPGAEARQIAVELQPEYLFTDEKLFVRMRDALPGAWQWIVYHTETAARALELTEQGAYMVETNDIGTLLRDPRLNPA